MKSLITDRKAFLFYFKVYNDFFTLIPNIVAPLYFSILFECVRHIFYNTMQCIFIELNNEMHAQFHILYFEVFVLHNAKYYNGRASTLNESVEKEVKKKNSSIHSLL